MNYIGTVLTYQNTPSIEKIYFKLEKEEVRVGQFITIKHKDLKIFGTIVEIFRENPFFEQVTSNYDDLLSKFPTDQWHNTIIEVKLLGQILNNKCDRIHNPPFSGSKVYFAKAEEIKLFLGLNNDGLYLGNIEGQENIDIKINMSKLIQKHLAILAMSGAGKSYTVSVLLEELLDIPKNKGPVGIILFDIHGEYKSFAEVSDKDHKSYHNLTKYFDAANMKFGVHSLDSLLFKFIGNLSEVQQRELNLVIKEFKSGDDFKVFDFKDLIKFIDEKEIKKNVKDPLLDTLCQIEETKLFAKTSTFNILNLVEPGKLTIVDLSNVLNMSHKQMIVAYISNKLFDLRRLNKISPFLIVLEEAHNFIPQTGSSEYMKARPIFETIAREGRKFGASLCLVSQRPVNLYTSVLSQCNTHLLLRIINPNDLKHILESSEGLDNNNIKLITGLNVGEALMVGSAVKYPVFFKVRPKKSADNKYEKDLETMSLEFIEKQENNDKDLDLYM